MKKKCDLCCNCPSPLIFQSNPNPIFKSDFVNTYQATHNKWNEFQRFSGSSWTTDESNILSPKSMLSYVYPSRSHIFFGLYFPTSRQSTKKTNLRPYFSSIPFLSIPSFLSSHYSFSLLSPFSSLFFNSSSRFFDARTIQPTDVSLRKRTALLSPSVPTI